MARTDLQRAVFRQLPDFTATLTDSFKLTGVSGTQELPFYLSLSKLKDFIGGGGVTIDLTYSQAASRISAETLVSGSIYKITDATQAQTGGKGSVYVTAIENNKFDTRGVWEITSDFKGFGWVDLGGSMIALDTVTVIAVDGANQLSGPVAFTTTYDALAIVIAANINANGSATYTAKAIKNRIVLQDKVTGVASDGLAVTSLGTNLTTSLNAQAVTNGQDDEDLYLECSYDFSLNEIMSARYVLNNVSISTTERNNSNLGHNPIYYLPFGDKNSGYGSGRDTFENSAFNGQTFKDVYYVASFFNDSTFESGMNWTVTNGAVLKNASFEYAHYIRGTFNFNGTICSYTGSNSLGFSRAIINNDAIFNFSDCELGGSSLNFGRDFNDGNFDISGGVFTPTSNCSYWVRYLGGFTMPNTTFTGRINIIGVSNFSVVANTINGDADLSVVQQSGDNLMVDVTGSSISGTVSIVIDAVNTELMLSSLTGSNILITGVFNNTNVDLDSTIFTDLSMEAVNVESFDLDSSADNTGLDIIMNNSSFKNSALTIPVVSRDFYMSNTEWSGDNFNFTNTRTLNAVVVGSVDFFQYVPDNYFTTSSLTEGTGFLGTGTLSVGLAGATTTMVPVTLGTALNAIVENTVITTKSTAVTAIEGTVAVATIPSSGTATLKMWVFGRIGL